MKPHCLNPHYSRTPCILHFGCFMVWSIKNTRINWQTASIILYRLVIYYKIFCYVIWQVYGPSEIKGGHRHNKRYSYPNIPTVYKIIDAVCLLMRVCFLWSRLTYKSSHNEPDLLVSDSAQKFVWEFSFWYPHPNLVLKSDTENSDHFLSGIWASSEV